jgi:hypothetical protein
MRLIFGWPLIPTLSRAGNTALPSTTALGQLGMLAISEPQRFQMGSRTTIAIWIITLAILAVMIAAAFYALAL